MAERFQLPLPIWRVQYQLQGGHKRMALSAIITATVLTVGFVSFRYYNRLDPLDVVANWAILAFAWIQPLVLILAGCHAVYRAILRDFNTKMLESHRLTPLSNRSVTLGYLFGSTIQVMVIAVVVCAFGAVLAGLGGSTISNWMAGNLLLALAALLLWAIVVFLGMQPKKPQNPAAGLIATALCTFLFLFAPGAGLLFGTFAAFYGIGAITGNMIPGTPEITALTLVSLTITAFWWFTAAAKYRRPELPALNAPRGLLLLGMWLVFSAAGMGVFSWFGGRLGGGFGDPGFAATQWTGTLGISLVFALFPINGTVHLRILLQRGASPRHRGDRISDVTTSAAAAVMVCVIMCGVGYPVWTDLVVESSRDSVPLGSAFWAWGCTFAAILTALFLARAALSITYPLIRTAPRFIALAPVIFIWVAPAVLDAAIAEAGRSYSDPFELSPLFGCSPIGTMILMWTEATAPVLPGLGVQAILATAVTFAANFVARPKTGIKQDESASLRAPVTPA